MRGRALRWGLLLTDLLVRALPGPLVYRIADLAGLAWHRLAGSRRALVTENLRRVSAATGRPTGGPELRRLVRQSFVEHARYYLELVRSRHYGSGRMADHLEVIDWPRWDPVLRGGVVVAIAHFGNFEPYGNFVAAQRIRVTAPVEEIEPRELFEFIQARRGAGYIDLVPVSRARRPMIEALRRHEVVAVAADRDLPGDGIEVSFFGLPTTMPAGPATLALMTGSPLIVASCRRLGPDRFRAEGWSVDVEPSGERRADVEAMTRAVARRFEAIIGSAPEQWFGAFQPIWADQREAGSAAPAGTAPAR
jgi:phosphatidylinositol dimannoside acyltransferase